VEGLAREEREDDALQPDDGPVERPVRDPTAAGRRGAVARTAAATLALAVAFLWLPEPGRAAPAAPAPAAGSTTLEALAATKAVTWDVDEEAKVITATVHLTFATPCTTRMMQATALLGPAAGARCRVDAATAKAISDNITSIWNKGNRYRCYVLQVVVDATVDNTAAEKRAPPSDDRVVVTIDQSPAGIRSFVTVNRNAGSTWSGSTPNDRLTPTNDGAPPTSWAYPPTWEKSLYAHEAAHVMGLEDTYEDYVGADGKTYSRPKAGAPDDVLSDVTKTTVDQKTVDRLVERADAFKGGKPTCDYKIDTKIGWYHFTSTKCGGPEGAWDILVDGVLDLGGGSLVLDGAGKATLSRTPKTASSKAFTGMWDATFRIDLVGVPSAMGGQQGTITGDATLEKSVLHLVGKTASGSFWAQTPALALGGSVDPLKSLDLPVTNGAFCP
jgi:hypothetical protein